MLLQTINKYILQTVIMSSELIYVAIGWLYLFKVRFSVFWGFDPLIWGMVVCTHVLELGSI